MKTAPKLKNAYDDHSIASDETGLKCPEPTLTQQHDEHDANINNIVAMFLKTGELNTHSRPPLNTDFEGVNDFQDALNLIVEAKNAFMEQPAHVRARFNNDAAQFVDFCSNAENTAEMRKLGLLSKEAMQAMDIRIAQEDEQRRKDRADAEAFRKAQEGPKS